MFSALLASALALFEFRFGFEPILYFVTWLEAAVQRPKVGELRDLDLAWPRVHGRDKPQRIERRWAID
jgi:hypothetical protein